MKFVTTACPRNCYSTCAIRVGVEQGRIRRIDPHPGNRATAGGPCLKGLSYVERVHAPDRLLRPLRRVGGADRFEPIDWDEALGTIAERLQDLKEGPGPKSLLYYAASGTKGLLNAVGPTFWREFGGYTTTYGDLCWPAGLEATRLTLGENKHSAPWDIAESRLILLWGKNAAETNIHQMVFVDEALRSGARLVVIDPRRTETAERAGLFLQPRPGTDGALALSVAHLLIRDDRIDRNFITDHVSGFAAFAESVHRCTPEWASEITGIPVARIRALTDELGTRKPATICPGYGMQRFTNSGQTMRALLALLVLTGNIGKPGAGWVYANLQSLVFDELKDPIACYPPERPDPRVRVAISTARLGPEMLELDDPPLRMAWIERGNPVTQNPESHTVLRALRALEFIVVVDQFLTDTAREADIVLPAKTMFEQTDVIGAYWHAYLQIKRKVIDPPGEVKPESEIYRLLGRRLGMSAAGDPERFPVSDDEVDAYLERKLAPFPELSLERLQEGPVPAPGQQEVAFSDFRFPTPSGKIELFSSEAVARWGVDSLPLYRPSVESLPEGGEEPAYPLFLLTPNTKNRIHSQFNNLAMIRQVSPKPVVSIHPVDAGPRGIADGQLVRVFNDRGTLRLQAHIDHSLLPGCVCVTNGWWISEGGTVNFCSAARETDMGHGAAFHDNRVQVSPADAA